MVNASQLPVLNWTQRSDWRNVKTAYHAVGDGTADDTAAIQAALNGASTGGTVYFPPGNYKVSATLALKGSELRNGIVLLGSGRSTTLSWYGPANSDFFSIDSNSYGRYEGFVLDGRGIAGRGFHQKNSMAPETCVRYKHVEFRNSKLGVSCEAGDFPSSEISFENCIFNNCGTGLAIVGKNECNFTVAGCDFVSSGQCGIACQRGNCYVRDCYFQGSGLDDLYLDPQHGVSVRRCKSAGSKQFINYLSGASPLVVQDCYVGNWTGIAGAILFHGGAPLCLSFSMFTHPPDKLPPIRCSAASPVIDHDNLAPDSPSVFSLAPGSKIYSVPAGRYPATIGGPAGTKITSFVDPVVKIPTLTYDAQTDFGAKGDGQADDTAAIQNTINSAIAKGNGAIAYLPAGKYKITATLTVTGANYTFGGSGHGTHLMWAGPAGGTLISVVNPSNVTVENMLVGSRDDGPQTNAVDIEQTQTNDHLAVSITYDGISVYGKRQNQPDMEGFRFNGLNNSSVTLNLVEGNLRFQNSAGANVMGNIAYDAAITVDETNNNARFGYLVMQTFDSTHNTGGVHVLNSNNLVVSDLYQDLSANGIALTGTPGHLPGRVTIQAAATGLLGSSTLMSINDYQGQIIYGPNQMSSAEPAVASISQTATDPNGTDPLRIVVFGHVLDNVTLAFSHKFKTAVLNTVGDWATNGKGNPTADAYSPSTLTDMTAACDDLQHLGFQDLDRNYQFVLVQMGF